MLTSAVSYVPYCESHEGMTGEPEQGTYAVYSPSVASSVELSLSTPADEIGEIDLFHSERKGVKYTDGATNYTALTIQDNATPVADEGNIYQYTDKLHYSCKTQKTALQYARGGPAEFVNTYTLPLYYGDTYTPDMYGEFSGQTESDIVRMMNYPQHGVYTDPVNTQQESTENSHVSRPIVTRASLYSRATGCTGRERVLKCSGSKTLVYNNCVNDPLIEAEDATFGFTEEVTGVPVSNPGPVCRQWFKEYTGCYYPAATLTRLRLVEGEDPFPDELFTYSTIVPNCYYEEISKSREARPAIGGVVCSSATEKSVVSIGSMFTLGKKMMHMQGDNLPREYHDYVTFGNFDDIKIEDAIRGNGSYQDPPSLSTDIPLPSTILKVSSMANSYVLPEDEQPWNEYMLSYNPAFVNVKDSEGDPYSDYRTAYKQQSTKIEYEEGKWTAESVQSLGYVFLYTSAGGETRMMSIPGCARNINVFNAKIDNAYTIAQAGNYVLSGICYNVPSTDGYNTPKTSVDSHLRQVKEIFPARITSVKCRIDPEVQQISGTSNGRKAGIEPGSPTMGSPVSLIDVETVASPRLFSFSPIDRQFEVQDVTTYNVPIMTTSSVMETETLDGSYSSFRVDGDTGENKVSRWPKAYNWAQENFETGPYETDEAFTGMGFFYHNARRMVYGLINPDGGLSGTPAEQENAIEWGGYIRVASTPEHDATAGNSKVVQSTQADVRGSSTTSYFFADIPSKS